MFQCKQVLPKYGFQTGQAGVLQMLAAASRFNDDEDLCTNRAVLNAPRMEAPTSELGAKKV